MKFKNLAGKYEKPSATSEKLFIKHTNKQSSLQKNTTTHLRINSVFARSYMISTNKDLLTTDFLKNSSMSKVSLSFCTRDWKIFWPWDGNIFIPGKNSWLLMIYCRRIQWYINEKKHNKTMMIYNFQNYTK